MGPTTPELGGLTFVGPTTPTLHVPIIKPPKQELADPGEQRGVRRLKSVLSSTRFELNTPQKRGG